MGRFAILLLCCLAVAILAEADRTVIIPKTFLARRSPAEKHLLQTPEPCPVDFVHHVDFSEFTTNKCPTNVSVYVNKPVDSFRRCCHPFFRIFCMHADILNNIMACADSFFSELHLLQYDTIALPSFCTTPLPENTNATGLTLNCDEFTSPVPAPIPGGDIPSSPPAPTKPTPSKRLPAEVAPVGSPVMPPSPAPAPRKGMHGGMHRSAPSPQATATTRRPPPPRAQGLQAEEPTAGEPTAVGGSTSAGGPQSGWSQSAGPGPASPPMAPGAAMGSSLEEMRRALFLLACTCVPLLLAL